MFFIVVCNKGPADFSQEFMMYLEGSVVITHVEV